MSSKYKIIAVALLGTLGLAACSSDIVAEPSDYDKPIIEIGDYDKEIYNNIMSTVYDAIRDGDLANNVLNDVLYQYSISVFGRYNKVVNSDSTATTLKEVVNDILAHTGTDDIVSGATIADEFIKSHKAYWTTDSDGNRINDDEEESTIVGEDAAPSQSEYARVLAKWYTIEDRISETLYSNISSGSYSTRSVFYEEKYLMSLLNNLYDVANPLVASEVSLGLTESLIYPDIEETQVFDTIDGIATTPLLHRSYYQSNYALDAQESASDANTYIEDQIIPEIYRSLLVEQYLLDETYNTLGRSYARKVNIIAITDNENYLDAADYLMTTFVKEYVNAMPAGDNGASVTSVADSTNKVDLDTFKMLSNAWRGIDLTADETDLLVSSKGFTADTYDGETFYLGTEYGNLMEKIKKINDDPLLTDTEIENEFTNNNSYPISVGQEIQTNNIRLKNYTTNGWFIKNGGLSDLPDSIRTRLFNIAVANALPEVENEETIAQDRWTYENGTWTYNPDNDVNSYVAKINGKYYLKRDTSEQGGSDSDMLFYDRSSSTYYIIQIEEAVSSSKLSKTSDNRYGQTRGDDVMEEVVNEVAKIIAKSESYSTLSTEYWLEQAALAFHDTVVYDYFKENYPDLFD